MRSHPVCMLWRRPISSAAIGVETSLDTRVRSTLVLGREQRWMEHGREGRRGGRTKAFPLPRQIGRGKRSCHTKRGEEREEKEGGELKGIWEEREGGGTRPARPAQQPRPQKCNNVPLMESSPLGVSPRFWRLRKQRALSTSSTQSVVFVSPTYLAPLNSRHSNCVPCH